MLETNISLSQIVSKKIYINPTEKMDFPLGLRAEFQGRGVPTVQDIMHHDSSHVLS